LTIRDQNRAERSTAGLSNIRAKLMLVLLCLLWGINWPVMKIALQEIPPLSMRTISSAFGALTLLGICAVSRRRFRIASAKAWGHLCVISLLNIGFFHSQRLCTDHGCHDSCGHPRLHNADLGGLAGMGGAARAAECQSDARLCCAHSGLRY
jgi:EamA-like transporter family protein